MESQSYPLSIFDTYYIVDNFYTNPDMIRNHAINESKEDTTGGNYAGIMTNSNFLTQEHLDTFARLVGHRVKSSTGFSGKFRFTKQNETPKQDIHFDPGDNNCAWAGVVYLTPNVPDMTDGTIFWRHKRTNLESIPRDEKGIKQFGDLKKFLDTEGIDHSLWDRVMSVSFKYNRLVLFRPWMFHSPGAAFGDSIYNCRLIQTFFLSPDIS